MAETLGDCGLLVPPSDPSALAAALIRLAREPELRRELGQRARQRARQRFDAQVVARQIAGVYQRALQPS
jgi:glycosyltransferase involved in cell wall biosynthesis